MALTILLIRYELVLLREPIQMFLIGVTTTTNSLLCFAYTAERLYATIKVRSYERQRPYLGYIACVNIVSAIIRLGEGKVRYS